MSKREHLKGLSLDGKIILKVKFALEKAIKA